MTQSGEYENAVNWLYDLQYFGMKLGLDNTRALLAEIDNPHEKLITVHVAGTNGKGSVCAILTRILMDAGLKVGTYTSPHLSDFGERICIDNIPMNRPDVLRSVAQIKPKVQALAEKGVQCTFFETTTCMAFRHFTRRKVDIAVIEVGMGGRLDSTNVIVPEVSVITNISREHTQHLGETLAEIAGEKAGIIKKGVPTVSAVPEPEPAAVIAEKARRAGSILHLVHELCQVKTRSQGILGSELSVKTEKHDYGTIRTKLPGAHQATNAATSAVAAEILMDRGIPISFDNIAAGISSARWAARLQLVRRRPDVILDATHNPGGAETLAAFLKAHYSEKPPVLILAMLEDKEVGPVVKMLEPLASRSIVSQSAYHRRMRAQDLASRFSRSPEIEDNLGSAIDRGIRIAGESGTLLITGSIYSAAEAIEHLNRLRLHEMIGILSGFHGTGAYPGKDPVSAGPPPPGSQDPFRVLISTILSQRTRDENTHMATEALFSKYRTPAELAAADPRLVEQLIRKAGFYRQKAETVISVSKILRDRHGSAVPKTLDELTALPGVGRKTANCVLSYGFGIPAIAVDTHVHRISNMSGLVTTANPDDTEAVLSRIVPKDLWHDINRLLVRHGQTVCSPIKPKCGACPISHLCDFGIYSQL